MKENELARAEDQVFGAILLQWGWTTKETIEECFAKRREMSTDGTRQRLDTILKDAGVLDAERIASAWETVTNAYSICRECANVHPHFNAPAPVKCSSCGSDDLIPLGRSVGDAGSAPGAALPILTTDDDEPGLLQEETGTTLMSSSSEDAAAVEEIVKSGGSNTLMELSSTKRETDFEAAGGKTAPTFNLQGVEQSRPAQFPSESGKVETPESPTKHTWPAEQGKPREKKQIKDGLVIEGDKKFFGNYEIVRELSRGGMGIVYIARQKGVSTRDVALKVMIAGEGATEEQIKRFQREAEASAKLSHPNIVPIFDVGVVGNQHYFTMEFIKGKPLDALIKEKSLDVRRTLVLMTKTARALHFAHEHGIIHRDIKPGNILVNEAGEPKLTDFGLAKDVGSQAEGEALTVSGAVMGTPRYMSPEQAEGHGKELDGRSDLFSLGAIFYEIIAQQSPFIGNTIIEVLRKVITEDPPSPRKFNRAIDRDVETICLKTLEKKKENRYQSCADFADDIDRYIAGDSIAARPASFAVKVSKKAKKYRGMLMIAGISLFLLVGAAAVLGFLQVKKAAQVRAKFDEAMKNGKEAFESRKFQDALQFFTEAKGLQERNEDARTWQQKSDAALKDAQEREMRETEARAKDDARKRTWQKNLEDFQAFLADAQAAAEAKDFDLADTRIAQAQALTVAPEETARAAELSEKIRGLRESHVAETRRILLDKLEKEATALESAAEAELGKGASISAAEMFDKAHEAWLKVASEFPEHDQAKARAFSIASLKICRIYLDINQFALARQFLKKLPAGDESVKAIAAELQQKEKIEGEYKERMKKGRDAIAEKRYVDAIGFIEQALTIADTPDARRDLAVAKAGRLLAESTKAKTAGEWERAFALAGEAAQAAPEEEKAPYIAVSEELRREGSLTLHDLASAEFEAGNLASARSLAKRSVELLPGDANRALLAQIVAGLDRPEGMVHLKAGSYEVGSKVPEENNPARTLRLAAFYVSIHEVTNREFLEFVEAGAYEKPDLWDEEAKNLIATFRTQKSGPSAAEAFGPAMWVDGKPKELEFDLPVRGISWFEARAYALFRGMRLPTSVEWEVAAVHDPVKKTRRKYPWGDEFDMRNPRRHGSLQGKMPLPVTRAGNPDESPSGCFDMAGNVIEWTDWSADGAVRAAAKGACFDESAPEFYSRATATRFPPAGKRLEKVGFRLARDAIK